MKQSEIPLFVLNIITSRVRKHGTRWLELLPRWRINCHFNLKHVGGVRFVINTNVTLFLSNKMWFLFQTFLIWLSLPVSSVTINCTFVIVFIKGINHVRPSFWGDYCWKSGLIGTVRWVLFHLYFMCYRFLNLLGSYGWSDGGVGTLHHDDMLWITDWAWDPSGTAHLCRPIAMSPQRVTGSPTPGKVKPSHLVKVTQFLALLR